MAEDREPVTATGRDTFGDRLWAGSLRRGPLCVGIDPHPRLLTSWGLPDGPVGLERFARAVVEAIGDQVLMLKPQLAFFERHGSAGLAVLERCVADARAAGALVLLDAKRGDIGSTMQAYAEAFLAPSSPLHADAVTLSPYLGVGALEPAMALARTSASGVFVLARTSNPEGRDLQSARMPSGRTVAQAVLDDLREANRAELAAGPARLLGSAGAVVGATRPAGGRSPSPAESVDLTSADLDISGALLAPGLGAQGAGPEDLASVFRGVTDRVVPVAARAVLTHGPDLFGLRRAAADLSAQCQEALQSS